jgi:tetratricopeptide (TPR) repeat protein
MSSQPSGLTRLDEFRRGWRGVVSLCVAALAVLLAGWGGWSWRQRANLERYQAECVERNAEQDWKGLAEVAKKWSDLEPTEAEPWLFRAAAAEGVKDWAGLVGLLDRVPRSSPKAVPALIRKAVAEFEPLNQPWDGLKTCDEVLRLEPKVLIAHKQAIFFCAMTMQRREMVRRIRAAIRERRESPESYVYLVGASWLNPGAAYRHNSRWLEREPDNETFLVARAVRVYGSQAKKDKERSAEFEHIPEAAQMLERFPRNLELIAWFLNLAITDGDVERVRSLLERVPDEERERDTRVLRARSWLEDADGKPDEAEALLSKALTIDPYWWQLHFQRHDLARRAGRAADAERFLEIYKCAKDASVAIMTMNRTETGFEDPVFLGSLSKLVDQVGDTEVSVALKERLAAR